MTHLADRRLPQLAASLMPVAALIGLWFLFFWRVLVATGSDRLTFQQGDFTLQFLAYRQLAYRQLSQGHFPVFEECLYSGYPFQADPQSQVLYPPVLIALLLGQALGWQTYPLEALEWEAALHVLWADLGTYLFLWRSLRLHRLAALFGALAFGFGGYLTGYPILQTGILQTAAWLPWLLMALRKLSYAPRWLLSALAAGATAALALTAGHPQTLLFMLYAGAFLFVVWGRSALSWRAIFARGAVAGAFAVGLSAAQLVPMLSFMLGSTRTAIPYEEVARGFPLQDVSLFLVTGVTNFYQPFYVGIATLILAVLAPGSARRKHHVWIVLALAALVLSFGANAFGFDLAYWLAPGYRLFRQQERHAFVVSFALAVLGALGAHTLLGPISPAGRLRVAQAGQALLRWAGFGLATFLVLLFLIQYRAITSAQDLSNVPSRVALLVVGLFGAAGLLLWRGGELRLVRRQWGGALIALLVFDLFTANRYTVTQPRAEPFPEHPLLKPLLAEPPPDRWVRLFDEYALPLNRACVAGLNEVGGGSPIVPAHYKAYLERTPEHVRLLQLNVRYAATWRGAMQTPEGVTIPWFLLARAKLERGEYSLYR
ncbi:MAG: hypothetical protein NZ693_08105, partial [Thermoflexales bacterium]|nr:hypothetical protein [Thermoflexales bacterium]